MLKGVRGRRPDVVFREPDSVHQQEAQGQKGEYVLQVLGAESTTIRDQQGQSLDLKALEGASVSGVALLPDAGFVVGFSNGATLTVRPSAKDAASEVPYWQFSCPSAFLVAGPGVRWSILRPDEAY